MELEPVSFQGLSAMDYAIAIGKGPNTQQEILVVSFTGICGIGAAGADDATFMDSIIVAALHAWEPWGLMLDFRHLEYVWGDEMMNVLCGGYRYLGVPDVPLTAIVSDLCREGLTSLVVQEMGEDPARWLFDDMPSALTELEMKMRARDQVQDIPQDN